MGSGPEPRHPYTTPIDALQRRGGPGPLQNSYFGTDRPQGVGETLSAGSVDIKIPLRGILNDFLSQGGEQTT
eukprot:6212938-Pleurochrysis_carterae.AAC.17